MLFRKNQNSNQEKNLRGGCNSFALISRWGYPWFSLDMDKRAKPNCICSMWELFWSVLWLNWERIWISASHLIHHCPDIWASMCSGWIGVNSSYLWDTFLRIVNLLQCRRGKCCISQFHPAGKSSLCPFNCWWKSQLQIKVFTFFKSCPSLSLSSPAFKKGRLWESAEAFHLLASSRDTLEFISSLVTK